MQCSAGRSIKRSRLAIYACALNTCTACSTSALRHLPPAVTSSSKPWSFSSGVSASSQSYRNKAKLVDYYNRYLHLQHHHVPERLGKRTQSFEDSNACQPGYARALAEYSLSGGLSSGSLVIAQPVTAPDVLLSNRRDSYPASSRSLIYRKSNGTSSQNRSSVVCRSRSQGSYANDNVASAESSTNSVEPNHPTRPSTGREPWQIQKASLKSKFCAEGWAPKKRLSPDALEGIRALHDRFPDRFTTPVLAEHFEVSAEAIRRILKSKWRPNDEETASRRMRWDKRGERIWSKMVALGVKPPKKWRKMGLSRPRRDEKVQDLNKPDREV